MDAIIEVKGLNGTNYIADDLDNESNIAFRRFTKAEILEEDESIIKLQISGLLHIKNVNKEFDSVAGDIPRLATVEANIDVELVYNKKDIDKQSKKLWSKNGKLGKINTTKVELFDKEGYVLEEIDQIKFDKYKRIIEDSDLYAKVAEKFNQEKWNILLK